MSCRTWAAAIAMCIASAVAAASEDVVPELKSAELRLNQLQYIGTHNSYHIEPDQAIDLLMLSTGYRASEKWTAPKLVKALSYSHPPLDVQLALGLRMFELDVYHDPDGGKFAKPGAFEALKKKGLPVDPPYDPMGEMKEPGFKVFHSADIDVRSTCLRFKRCLEQVRRWSDAHPGHLPIMLQIEAKTAGQPPLADAYTPVSSGPFTAEVWRQFEAEILSVLPRERLLTPDDVRGDYPTLKEAIASAGWPRVSETLGKVMFVLMHDDESTRNYVAMSPALRSRLMFANAPTGDPSSVWLLMPNGTEEDVRKKVNEGYLVYVRADADTREARNNDGSRRDRAFRSGAQFISTDYPFPDYRFSTYEVRFSNGGYVRCNPVTAPDRCARGQAVKN